MGRKKRPAASQVSHEIPPAPPPHLHNATLDAYGRPLPPPIPPPPDEEEQHQEQPPSSKRSRNGDDESYLVKKYRADSYYRSIEAFTKYTKAHRMLDASYVRWTAGGETDEKPNVFGIRIAGTFLSWGRGKTRDAAIDASIRAAFALVAAHGYDDFTLTDDCFTEEPVASALAPIPPPPPPPPPGMPPMPPGFAPPAGMPPDFPPPPDMLIPQPAAPKAELAVASGISNAASVGGASTKPITLEMPSAASGGAAAAASSAETSKKKANVKLVFSGEEVDDAGEEMSMEEIRMRVPRYWNMITRAMEKKKSSKDS